MNKGKFYEMAKRYQDNGRIDKAYQFYLEAVLSENDADAMYELGYMYYEGDYVDEDYDKAGYYFAMAYDNGADVLDDFTLIIAGSYWEKRAEDENDKELLKKAMKYYQADADRGAGYGNECLAKCYYEFGEFDKALENLSLLGDDMNSLGLYYMGKLYDDGYAIKQNIPKAIEYYKKTVEIGSKYEDEYGEDRDTALARARLKELGVS